MDYILSQFKFKLKFKSLEKRIKKKAKNYYIMTEQASDQLLKRLKIRDPLGTGVDSARPGLVRHDTQTTEILRPMKVIFFIYQL